MPKLRLGVLERSAGHLKHGGVRPPERVPTEPRSPYAAAGWFQLATEQVGIAESCSATSPEHKRFFRTFSGTRSHGDQRPKNSPKQWQSPPTAFVWAC